MDTLTHWLLSGPPWAAYRAQVDLLNLPAADPQVAAARVAMLADPKVQALVAGLANWPGVPLNSHKSAGHPLHQLVFLADLGLTRADPGVAPFCERVLSQPSAQGPFPVLMNIPAHFGGSGKDELAWALCDAPLLLYALACFGYAEHPAVQKAAEHLAGLGRANGWPCAVSPELGRFRGPGSKGDPCPYANLVMLKALAQIPGCSEHPAVQPGLEAALALWTERRERHPYMFFMGDDFCKLKAPLVWYDILHVLDVLSRFPAAQSDPRLQELAARVRTKADAEGRFTPESIWTAWKDWDFGQKKQPSPWLTLIAERALRRMA